MNNRKYEATLAITLIVLAFVLVACRFGAVENERMLIQPVPGQYPCVVDQQAPYWATVTRKAPLFEGCGMYTPMVGTARVGEGVQVLSEHDGWAWVWHHEHMEAPVYVQTAYLTGER